MIWWSKKKATNVNEQIELKGHLLNWGTEITKYLNMSVRQTYKIIKSYKTLKVNNI